MKKPDKRLYFRLGALALTAVLLGTGAALAAGDQSDPLVTLSYLNQTALLRLLHPGVHVQRTDHVPGGGV